MHKIEERKIYSLKTNLAGAEKRRLVLVAKNNARPGIFESLGAYNLHQDDAELFSDDHYRRLMNILIYRSQI
ncbi:MAG: hypothetical protein ACE5E9_01610 [Nitrospinaceae bacterium]